MASNSVVIVDTGPLIAYFNRKDPRHEWVKTTADALEPPFVTSESVLSEVCFLLDREQLPCGPLFELITQGAIVVEFDLQIHCVRVRTLMKSYADQPMSLADASLVCLAEQNSGGAVFTLDRHFRIYRRNGRQLIPLIIPDDVR